MADDQVARAVEAIRAGEPVLLPADGVYGLCASPYREEAVRRLYRLKGRDESMPTAMVVASVEVLLECLPELRGRSEAIARTLLPGPYTLILGNPAGRFRWLNGTRPDAIGVRVADLPAESQRVLDAVGAVAATSANEPGEPPAASLDEVPDAIRLQCAAEVGAGRLTGVPSTVIDFTGRDAVVLREGVASSSVALARVAEALGE